MGLRGKLVSELSIKYSKGDAFHLFRYPNNIPLISPQRVQSVDLLSGQWGSVGSVIFYNITIAGKKKVAKEITEAVDEEKRWITYKMIEGNLMELYSAFRLGFNVETNGEDHLVTITLDYEKMSEAVPDPHAVMDNIRGVVKDMERYHSIHPK